MGGMHTGWWYQQMTAEALTSRQPREFLLGRATRTAGRDPLSRARLRENKMGKMMMGCV